MDYYHDHQDLDHFLSPDQLDDHSSLINLSDHGSDHHQIPGHSTPSSSITDLIKYPYHNYYVHPNCYSSDDHDLNPTNFQEESSHVSGSEPDDTGSTKIAFRTRTQLETLDDGFKWRKYGKKMVKKSPYPRNYYKCSSRGCGVKKRVERDSEDSSMLITTYQGRHNHQSPTGVVYNVNQ